MKRHTGKTRKTLPALLILFMLSFCLCACGSSKDSDWEDEEEWEDEDDKESKKEKKDRDKDKEDEDRDKDDEDTDKAEKEADDKSSGKFDPYEPGTKISSKDTDATPEELGLLDVFGFGGSDSPFLDDGFEAESWSYKAENGDAEGSTEYTLHFDISSDTYDKYLDAVVQYMSGMSDILYERHSSYPSTVYFFKEESYIAFDRSQADAGKSFSFHLYSNLPLNTVEGSVRTEMTPLGDAIGKIYVTADDGSETEFFDVSWWGFILDPEIGLASADEEEIGFFGDYELPEDRDRVKITYESYGKGGKHITDIEILEPASSDAEGDETAD